MWVSSNVGGGVDDCDFLVGSLVCREDDYAEIIL